MEHEYIFIKPEIEVTSMLGGIPLRAIADFRQSLYVGQELMLRIRLPKIDNTKPSFQGEQLKLRYFTIKAVYPHHVYMTDTTSILYPDLMKLTGWWDKNKRRYYGD